MSIMIFQHPKNRFFSGYCFLLGFMLIGSIQSCQEDKSKVIAEKVAERVDDFRRKKKEECRKSLLSKAEKKVDSLLLAEAQQLLQDSLGRLRPFRPGQPPVVPPIDSLAVEPLFKR
jgi:hypothetical protein